MSRVPIYTVPAKSLSTLFPRKNVHPLGNGGLGNGAPAILWSRRERVSDSPAAKCQPRIQVRPLARTLWQALLRMFAPANKHACIHGRIRAHMHAYIHTNMHAYTYMRAYLHTCIRAYIHTNTLAHTYTHTHTHAYRHISQHSYIHTHIRIYTHIYTCIQSTGMGATAGQAPGNMSYSSTHYLPD